MTRRSKAALAAKRQQLQDKLKLAALYDYCEKHVTPELLRSMQDATKRMNDKLVYDATRIFSKSDQPVNETPQPGGIHGSSAGGGGEDGHCLSDQPDISQPQNTEDVLLSDDEDTTFNFNKFINEVSSPSIHTDTQTTEQYLTPTPNISLSTVSDSNELSQQEVNALTAWNAANSNPFSTRSSGLGYDQSFDSHGYDDPLHLNTYHSGRHASNAFQCNNDNNSINNSYGNNHVHERAELSGDDSMADAAGAVFPVVEEETRSLNGLARSVEHIMAVSFVLALPVDVSHDE